MMFGPDTALMIDALEIAAVVAAITGASVFWLMRRRKPSKPSAASPDIEERKSRVDLEERVRVLERIATDRSEGLAEEIEGLRDKTLVKGQDA